MPPYASDDPSRDPQGAKIPWSVLRKGAKAGAEAGAKAGAKVSDDVLKAGLKGTDDILKNALKNSDDIAKIAAKNADDAAKLAAKNADDIAKIAAKNADDAAKLAAKNADDLAKVAAKNADEAAAQVLKVSDDLTASAGKAGKRTATQTRQEAIALMKKYPGVVVGGVALSALSATALGVFAKKNGAKLTVTKIEKREGGGTLVTYKPALELLKTDTVDIASTDCVPPIDGKETPIRDVVSKTQIVIAKEITGAGTIGALVVNTSYGGIMKDLISDTVAAAIDETIDIVKDAGDKVIDANPDLAGLGPRFVKYGKIAVGCVGVAGVLYVLFQVFKPAQKVVVKE